MKIAFVTLFPELVESASRWGVTGRALERGQWFFRVFNPRDYSGSQHRSVDDRPFGGGPGMVMMVEPVRDAIFAAQSWIRESATSDNFAISDPQVPEVPVVLMTPQGARFRQATARAWSACTGLVFVCGRYEGIDARINHFITAHCSLGDFVLSGGEIAALAITDAIVRLRPGVLGDDQSSQQESFSFGLLDHPHFTRPADLGALGNVPPVLLSGDHAAISQWRRQQALALTQKHRPDLIDVRQLTREDMDFLRSLGYNPD